MFDIYQLDKEDEHYTESEEALYKYQETVVELFAESSEGREHRKTYKEIGF